MWHVTDKSQSISCCTEHPESHPTLDVCVATLSPTWPPSPGPVTSMAAQRHRPRPVPAWAQASGSHASEHRETLSRRAGARVSRWRHLRGHQPVVCSFGPPGLGRGLLTQAGHVALLMLTPPTSDTHRPADGARMMCTQAHWVPAQARTRPLLGPARHESQFQPGFRCGRERQVSRGRAHRCMCTQRTWGRVKLGQPREEGRA